jgi:aryl-alcohol dehydrogenase-like predicted oxidoreductase
VARPKSEDKRNAILEAATRLFAERGLTAAPTSEMAPMILAVKSVSEQTGRSMAQVALAWLRHQTVPVIPIIGARKVSQLQDNLASLDMELSAEQLKSLDGASRIEPGFPQSIYDREMVRAIRYGGTWDRLLLSATVAG